MRTTLPKMLCIGCGIIMLIQFFVPLEFVQRDMLQWVNDSAIIVATFGLAIGLASLVHVHSARIRRRAPGWALSVVTLTCAVIVAVIGLLKPEWGPVVARSQRYDMLPNGVTASVIYTTHTLFGYQPDTTFTNLASAAGTLPAQQRSVPMFDWFYNYIMYPLMSTVFALLAFYMMTAAYRAMRAKSWEAGLLLAAALVVLLGQVPVDQFVRLPAIEGVSLFEWLKLKILDYPNTAAKRSIIIGVALGGLATSIKILTGIEKPYLGGRG